MKHVIAACVILNLIKSGHFYVVTPSKDAEITTASQKNPLNGSEAENDSKQIYRKELMSKENYIYLDDVIYALKHRNWTEEEEPCLEQTLRLIYNLQNSTLWAVWDWDSTSSEPEGILFGNRYHLGNYDECMRTPWYDTHPDLRTQYCLAEIELERYDKRTVKKQLDILNPYSSALNYIESRSSFQRPLNKVTWGACVPVICSPSSVKQLLEVMLARSYVGAAGLHANISITEDCQKVDHTREYNGLFFTFVGTIGSLFIVVLICTYMNRKMGDKPQDTSIGRNVMRAFCLKENLKDLYKVQRDGVEVLYGVRFLSMCVVVLAHQYGMFNGGPITNAFNVDKEAMTIWGMLLLHEDVVVDTFFLLSGFLTARGIVKLNRLPNLIVLILKRYVRLMVAYAVIIFFIVSAFEYTGNGPLWNRVVTGERDPCLQNWWLSILMLSNYIDTNNMCLIVSWYIPCDFHFFVITILLYWLYKKLPSFGCVCVTIVTIASVIVPGVINYVYKLPAIQLFTYDFISSPRSQLQFHTSYIKSHNRYAPYLVGFFFGYYFVKRSTSGRLRQISWQWLVLAAWAGIAVMLLTMLSGPALVWAGYGLVIDAIYAALSRPIWSISLALVVFCCSLGKILPICTFTAIVTSFLSWYPWVPLSRLAYGLYVTHSLIITRNVHVIRNPQHTDHLILLNSTVGVICWGCFASLAIWLLAEAPINNLLTLYLTPRKNHMEAEQNVSNVNENRSTVAEENKGYLPDNLPNNICYSSKI